jgi:uncharacterized protein (TIGR02466 family)
VIETLYSLDIYRTRLDNVDRLSELCTPEFLSKLYLTQNEYTLNTDVTLSGAKSWHRIKDAEKLHHWPEFKEISNFVTKHAKIYWDHLGYWPDVEPKPYQSWVNVFERGGQVDSHSHNEVPLAAVVYLSASPEQGNIVFETPMYDILGFLPINNKIKRLRHEMTINTGDVIIFPGYLRHFSFPNTTDTPRISYAINFNDTGIYHNPYFAKE